MFDAAFVVPVFQFWKIVLRTIPNRLGKGLSASMLCIIYVLAVFPTDTMPKNRQTIFCSFPVPPQTAMFYHSKEHCMLLVETQIKILAICSTSSYSGRTFSNIIHLCTHSQPLYHCKMHRHKVLPSPKKFARLRHTLLPMSFV